MSVSMRGNMQTHIVTYSVKLVSLFQTSISFLNSNHDNQIFQLIYQNISKVLAMYI